MRTYHHFKILSAVLFAPFLFASDTPLKHPQQTFKKLSSEKFRPAPRASVFTFNPDNMAGAPMKNKSRQYLRDHVGLGRDPRKNPMFTLTKPSHSAPHQPNLALVPQDEDSTSADSTSRVARRITARSRATPPQKPAQGMAQHRPPHMPRRTPSFLERLKQYFYRKRATPPPSQIIVKNPLTLTTEATTARRALLAPYKSYNPHTQTTKPSQIKTAGIGSRPTIPH